MIVVDNPLADVLFDVGEELEFGTVHKAETIVHLTQAHDFLPVRPVICDNGISKNPSHAVSKYNRKSGAYY